MRKTKTLALVLTLQTTFSMMHLIAPSSIMVPESKSKGVSTSAAGIILASSSLIPIFLGFFTSRLTNRFGKEKILMYCIIVEACLTFLFGVCEWISKSDAFLALTLLIRLIQGGHLFMHKSLGYMLTSKYLPQYYEIMVSFLNVGVNLGSSFALQISTFLYFRGNKNLALPLFIYSFMNFLFLLPLSYSVFKKPKQLARVQTDLEMNSPSSINSERQLKSATQKQSLIFPLKNILIHPFSLLYLWVGMLAVFGGIYFLSSLSSELMETYNLSAFTVSFIYLAKPFLTITGLLLSPLVRKCLSRRTTVLVFIGMQGLAILGIGPSSVLNLPQSLPLKIVSLSLKGLTEGICFPSILPRLLEQLNAIYSDRYLKESIGDRVAGIFVMCLELGVLLSFALGTFLYQSLGFRASADLVGGVFFLTFVILFLERVVKRE